MNFLIFLWVQFKLYDYSSHCNKIIVIRLFKSAYRENYAYLTNKNKRTRKLDTIKFYHRH